MTRIVETRVLERCVDSVYQVEMMLDAPADERVMRRLAQGAKLSFYADFPRPLFKIDAPKAWYIVGLIGSAALRVTCIQPVECVADALNHRVLDPSDEPGAGPPWVRGQGEPTDE
jgi:hypothetical protein